jgi:hypothetical protein
LSWESTWLGPSFIGGGDVLASSITYQQIQRISPGIPEARRATLPRNARGFLMDITHDLDPNDGIDQTAAEFNNCFVHEGCLGQPFAVVELVNGVARNLPLNGFGNLPDEIPFPFTISLDERLAIRRTRGFGTLTVEASRDIDTNQVDRPAQPNPDIFERNGRFYKTNHELLMVRATSFLGKQHPIAGQTVRIHADDLWNPRGKHHRWHEHRVSTRPAAPIFIRMSRHLIRRGSRTTTSCA